MIVIFIRIGYNEPIRTFYERKFINKGVCSIKKSVLISLIALGISLIGLVIALAAWLHKKKDLICDDFDDDLLTDEDEDAEYIAAPVSYTHLTLPTN